MIDEIISGPHPTDIKGWTRADAVLLCIAIEQICPTFGCHVALTGGTLYKHGVRKDADILFYRIRQKNSIDVNGLFDALKAELDIVRDSDGLGFCVKAKRHGKGIDFFFPEADGFYKPQEE